MKKKNSLIISVFNEIIEPPKKIRAFLLGNRNKEKSINFNTEINKLFKNIEILEHPSFEEKFFTICWIS